VRIARVEDRLDGVERAGADVAEDDTQSADDESRLGWGAQSCATGVGIRAQLVIESQAGGRTVYPSSPGGRCASDWRAR
jgi:hypothetical protein